MLVFLLFIIVVMISIMVFYFMKIKIVIHELEINYADGNNKNYIKIRGIIYGKIFNKLKIFKINFNEKQINRIITSDKTTKIYRKILKDRELNINKVYITSDYIKRYIARYNIKPIEISNMDFRAELGLFDLEITTVVVVIISIFFSIVMQLLDTEDNQYQIKSSLKDNNIVQIKLFYSSIITINLKHIINIMIKFIKERRKLNDRKSSNRRFAKYSYEQY